MATSASGNSSSRVDPRLGRSDNCDVRKDAKKHHPTDSAELPDAGGAEHPPEKLQRCHVFMLRVVITLVFVDGDALARTI